MRRKLLEWWNRTQNWFSGFWRAVRYWYDVLEPARASFIGSALVPILFLVVDQGKDILRRLATDTQTIGSAFRLEVFFMIMGLFLLGVASWGWAKFLLNCEFPESLRFDQERAHTERVRKFFRRSCGLLPSVGLAVAFTRLGWTASSFKYSRAYYLFAAVCVFIGVLLYACFEKRVKMQQVGGKDPAPTRYRSLADVWKEKETLHMIVMTVSVSVLMFIVFTMFPVFLGLNMGSAGVIMVALASWITIGSWVVYWGNHYRVPVITALLLFAAVFSFWVDNHQVRMLGTRGKLQTFEQALEVWHADVASKYAPNESGEYPLFLVAAAGGGIRAAYWTAIVLGAIEDEANRNKTSLADNTFAISGVSGGSLGGIVFVTMKSDPRTVEGGFFKSTRRYLDQDFLAADLAKMAFGDLLQRFTPVSVQKFDRARTLENAWASAWPENQLNQSIGDLYRGAKAKGTNLPHLLLNGTLVETGQRVITSDLQIRSRYWTNGQVSPAKGEFLDVVAATDKLTNEIRLSTAAHQSARFTYFSPPGTFPDKSRVVDGGYFENSGAATLVDAMEAIRRINIEKGFKIGPMVILIDNDPLDTEQRLAIHPHIFGELLTPVFALYNTRTARGSHAAQQALDYRRPEATLMSAVAATNQMAQMRAGDVFEFHLYKSGVTLSLGWTLYDGAIREMNSQLTNRHGPVIRDIVARLPSQKRN